MTDSSAHSAGSVDEAGLAAPDFVLSNARFSSAEGKVRVDVTRNLSPHERVDEIYVTYILRGDNSYPGYYGDAHVRRSDRPDAPELSQVHSTFVLRVAVATASDPPQRPTKPSPDPLEKHWFDITWLRKDGANSMKRKFHFFLPVKVKTSE